MEVLLQLGAKHSLKFHLSPPWDTERYVLSSLITFQREGSGSWERPSWVVKLLKGFQKLLNIKRAEKNFAVTSFLKRILLMKGFLRLLLFSCSVLSNSLLPYWLQHARHPCPSPSPGACSNSCPLSRWWHPTISSSVIPFFSFLQSFPASGSFPKSLLFTSDGQSIGASASASVFSMNIQGWFPVGLTGFILLSKGLSRVFSSVTSLKRSVLWHSAVTSVHNSSKKQASFHFMVAVTICSDFGAQENNVCHYFNCFPIYLWWGSFLNVEF